MNDNHIVLIIVSLVVFVALVGLLSDTRTVSGSFFSHSSIGQKVIENSVSFDHATPQLKGKSRKWAADSG